MADDDDGETVTYTLVEPDDEDNFSINEDTAALTINEMHTPDYEARSSYTITIVASSGEDDDARSTRLTVTVRVTDAEDTGEVVLSQREPQVGQSVVASVDDEDGGVTITAWQWYKNIQTGTVLTELTDELVLCDAVTADSTACRIENANSASYEPTDDERGSVLAAKATYTDNIQNVDDQRAAIDDPTQLHAVTERAVQVSNPANTAPKFPDQDPNTLGDQSDETSREVAENTKAKQSIGAPVGAGDTDLLLYTLSGADAESFGIDRKTGQLTTKADLDFETKATYTVMVTATDPSGATDSILVTINVTDVDDDPVITLVTGEDTTDPVEDTTDPVEDTTDPVEDTTDC